MNSKNTKSSVELKKEVLDDLRRVENDLDRLEQRLTPGQLIDDAIYYNHGANARATFDHMKNNPVGSAFLALGTFLLMEDSGHQSYETLVRNQAEDAYVKSKNRMSSFKSQAKNRVDAMKTKIQSKISSGKSKLKGASESGKSRASELKDRLSAGYSSSVSYVHEMNPITFVALGAGLGALTGSSLPVRESEKKLINDKLGSRLEDFTNDLQAALNDSARIFRDEFVSEVKGQDVKIFKNEIKHKFTGLEGQEGI